MGTELFTELIVLKVQDQASKIWEKAEGAVDKFTGSLDKAAESASVAGKAIDESLLQTESGADAVTLANTRLEASAIKLSDARKAQAEAETALLDVQKEVETGTLAEADANIKLTAAADNLAAAQERTAKASKAFSDAQATATKTTEAAAAKDAEAAGAADVLGKKSEGSSSKLGKVASFVGKMGIGVDIAAGLMVKAAGNFQDASEHLVTDAGESQSQLNRVQTAMLNIAAATGTSSTDIVNGMYHIESSIDHTKPPADRATQAIQELTVAAQGAKVGGADLDTTTKALVGSLTAYAGKGYSITGMMNALIATTGSGDMRLQDLAGSMANVTAQAASAGIGFEQIGGAIATMTAQGFTADRATQDLANTISNLQKPSIQATQEMQGLGINVNDVSENLGKRGLSGTLAMFTQALAAHSPHGEVFIDTLKSSQAAAANLDIAMKKLPASLQDMAKGLLNGTVTASEWSKATKDLPVGQSNLAKQFLQLTKNADSFNQLLKSGKGDAQTFNAALSTMMGGSTGLTTALMLTGQHTGYFNDSVKTVGQSLHSTSKDVENWDKIQGTFNQKMSEAKQSLMSAGIAIGTALLPAVSKIADAIMKVLGPLTHWIEQHQTLVGYVLGGLGAFMSLVGIVNLGVKAFGAIGKSFKAVGDVAKFAWKGISLIGDGLGKLPGLISAVGDGFSSVFGFIGDQMSKVPDILSAAGDGIGKLGSALGKGLSVARTFAASMLEAAANITKAGLMAAWSGIKFLAMQAAEIAVTVATKLWTAAQWLFNAAMAVDPIYLVIAAIAALVAGVIYAYTHFKWFRDIVQDVMNFFKAVVKDTIDFVKAHWDLIVDIIMGPLGIVVTQVIKHWSDIKRWFMDGVHAVENVLSWFGSLPGKFLKWLGDMNLAIAQKINDAINWFTNLPNKIGDLLKDAGSWLINVGEDIIKGLGQGIDNMVGWVENKVKGIGSGIVNSVKSFLGIGSPSKLMADEVGRWLPAGIAVGFENNLGPLQNAARSAGEIAVGGARAGLSSPLVSSGGGGSGGGVYIDLRNTQVMTDRDMDVLINKLGRALAVRVAPQAGLRVRM